MGAFLAPTRIAPGVIVISHRERPACLPVEPKFNRDAEKVALPALGGNKRSMGRGKGRAGHNCTWSKRNLALNGLQGNCMRSQVESQGVKFDQAELLKETPGLKIIQVFIIYLFSQASTIPTRHVSNLPVFLCQRMENSGPPIFATGMLRPKYSHWPHLWE